MCKLLLKFPEHKVKALTLSYDDGTIYDGKLVEILDKYKIKCTFNINSGMFSASENDRPKRRLTKQEVLDLYGDTVHEIAVHGVHHLRLTECDLHQATQDVVEDKNNLERLFDRKVQGMAYAYGAYNDEIVAMLKDNGIKYSRTTITTEKFDIPTDWLRLPTTCHHNNPNLFALADEFVNYNGNELKMFYLWGHSYEFNDNNNWDIIENFAQKTGLKKDIWYATNMEIYNYINSFNNLQYSADKTNVTNNSNIDLYINYNGKNIVVKAKQSIVLLS